jgi:hypothetical protein
VSLLIHIWQWTVLLCGAVLAGGTAYVVWAYRRSHRMHHILPLGVSYLFLVAGSVASYWRGPVSWSRWEVIALIAAYGLGAWGLARLVATSLHPPVGGKDTP